MKKECDRYKCMTPREGEAIYVEGGKNFYFCRECSEELDKLTTGYTVTSFAHSTKSGWVERNMKDAQERRAKGEVFDWSSKPSN